MTKERQEDIPPPLHLDTRSIFTSELVLSARRENNPLVKVILRRALDIALKAELVPTQEQGVLWRAACGGDCRLDPACSHCGSCRGHRP